MPPYASFKSLTEYIDARRARDSLSRDGIADRLGLSHAYISGICETRSHRPPAFVPSVEICDALAQLFGDAPHLVRVLAGR
jgi:hypothetical protein